MQSLKDLALMVFEEDKKKGNVKGFFKARNISVTSLEHVPFSDHSYLGLFGCSLYASPVSYTHLTLPTRRTV